MQERLRNFFSEYMTKESIFLDKKLLTHNYIPEQILHRDEQISTIARILAPSLRMEPPSNIFVFGTTGTGKSVAIKFIFNELRFTNPTKVEAIYVNCKLRTVSDTEYRLLSYMLREMGYKVPDTGLPTEVLYNKFFEIIDSKEQIVLLALDELDALVNKIGDGVLYNLTRANTELKHAKIAIVGISNNLSFTDNIDPRVKSSLSVEEVIFPPYNALQLKDILMTRAKKALKEGSYTEAVIGRCAALAAQEQGDARRALDLFRVAAELAERNDETIVTEKHLSLAEQKLELDRVVELAKTQPRHSQLILYSILKLFEKGQENILTGDVYDIYIGLCKRNGYRVLTQRRISDLISELDMLGLVSTKVISKGRYGRTREIRVAIAKRPFDILMSQFKGIFEV